MADTFIHQHLFGPTTVARFQYMIELNESTCVIRQTMLEATSTSDNKPMADKNILDNNHLSQYRYDGMISFFKVTDISSGKDGKQKVFLTPCKNKTCKSLDVSRASTLPLQKQ